MNLSIALPASDTIAATQITGKLTMAQLPESDIAALVSTSFQSGGSLALGGSGVGGALLTVNGPSFFKGAVTLPEAPKTDQLFDFSGVIDFTPCGQTGPVGPTLTNCASAYARGATSAMPASSRSTTWCSRPAPSSKPSDRPPPGSPA
jgi:hypothetical protein